MGVQKLAERVGFEPTVRIKRTTIFETVAFDHSAISPQSFFNIAPDRGDFQKFFGNFAKKTVVPEDRNTFRLTWRGNGGTI